VEPRPTTAGPFFAINSQIAQIGTGCRDRGSSTSPGTAAYTGIRLGTVRSPPISVGPATGESRANPARFDGRPWKCSRLRTITVDHIRALTARRPIKPTSIRCPSAWQPNFGRRSTYRRGKSVQTTGTTSVVALRLRMLPMLGSDNVSVAFLLYGCN
jgi:hypothetical protein